MSGSTHNDGGPAFPTGLEYAPKGFEVSQGMTLRDYFAGQALISQGMTLRDYFAGQALMGILNNAGCFADMKDSDVAENAYRAADAMLKAREVVK
jgi:hypothetical protein